MSLHRGSSLRLRPRLFNHNHFWSSDLTPDDSFQQSPRRLLERLRFFFSFFTLNFYSLSFQWKFFEEKDDELFIGEGKILELILTQKKKMILEYKRIKRFGFNWKLKNWFVLTPRWTVFDRFAALTSVI